MAQSTRWIVYPDILQIMLLTDNDLVYFGQWFSEYDYIMYLLFIIDVFLL